MKKIISFACALLVFCTCASTVFTVSAADGEVEDFVTTFFGNCYKYIDGGEAEDPLSYTSENLSQYEQNDMYIAFENEGDMFFDEHVPSIYKNYHYGEMIKHEDIFDCKTIRGIIEFYPEYLRAMLETAREFGEKSPDKSVSINIESVKQGGEGIWYLQVRATEKGQTTNNALYYVAVYKAGDKYVICNVIPAAPDEIYLDSRYDVNVCWMENVACNFVSAYLTYVSVGKGEDPMSYVLFTPDEHMLGEVERNDIYLHNNYILPLYKKETVINKKYREVLSSENLRKSVETFPSFFEKKINFTKKLRAAEKYEDYKVICEADVVFHDHFYDVYVRAFEVYAGHEKTAEPQYEYYIAMANTMEKNIVLDMIEFGVDDPCTEYRFDAENMPAEPVGTDPIADGRTDEGEKAECTGITVSPYVLAAAGALFIMMLVIIVILTIKLRSKGKTE